MKWKCFIKSPWLIVHPISLSWPYLTPNMKSDFLPVLPVLRMKVSSKVSFSHPWNLSFFRFTFTWVRSSSILIGDCLAPLQAEYFFPQFFWFKVPKNQIIWVNKFKTWTGIHVFFNVGKLKHSLQSVTRVPVLLLGLICSNT